jgi:hypothetical protein
VTREKKAEIEEQREKMRAQIAFYASTPTYRTVLEAHGWEEVGERLGNSPGTRTGKRCLS